MTRITHRLIDAELLSRFPQVARGEKGRKPELRRRLHKTLLGLDIARATKNQDRTVRIVDELRDQMKHGWERDQIQNRAFKMGQGTPARATADAGERQVYELMQMWKYWKNKEKRRDDYEERQLSKRVWRHFPIGILERKTGIRTSKRSSR